MHHAVTPEPVMTAAWRELRVRAIAVIRAVKRFWDFAGHREIERITLDEDGREDALQRRLVLGEWTGNLGPLCRRVRVRYKNTF